MLTKLGARGYKLSLPRVDRYAVGFEVSMPVDKRCNFHGGRGSDTAMGFSSMLYSVQATTVTGTLSWVLYDRNIDLFILTRTIFIIFFFLASCPNVIVHIVAKLATWCPCMKSHVHYQGEISGFLWSSTARRCYVMARLIFGRRTMYWDSIVLLHIHILSSNPIRIEDQ